MCLCGMGEGVPGRWGGVGWGRGGIYVLGRVEDILQVNLDPPLQVWLHPPARCVRLSPTVGEEEGVREARLRGEDVELEGMYTAVAVDV